MKSCDNDDWYMDNIFLKEFANYKFEILSEEDEEIDIDKIEEMRNPENWKACDIDIANIVRNVNELTKAVKQLNKKIGGK